MLSEALASGSGLRGEARLFQKAGGAMPPAGFGPAESGRALSRKGFGHRPADLRRDVAVNREVPDFPDQGTSEKQ